jgi:hypothetical protein
LHAYVALDVVSNFGESLQQVEFRFQEMKRKKKKVIFREFFAIFPNKIN